MRDQNRRVVITGMGVISPVGNTTADFWQALVDGRHGFAPLTSFDTSAYKAKLAAEVKHFDATDYLDRKEARRMDRNCHFAMAAAQEAMRQSGLDIEAVGAFRVGTIIGSGIGGIITHQIETEKLLARGPRGVSPLFIPMLIANMAAGHVSMQYGSKGPNFCVTTACASGTHAIGEAFLAIRRGDMDACITGGTEAPICEIALAGFANMTALSTSEDPDRASIPFDQERDGFVIAEGAGILILEALEIAQARGATILAEVVGYGATADAFHITSPDPSGEGPAQAMTLAMAQAGIEASQVDYINAHGTSTPLNDLYETLAIKRALGEAARRVAISSTKSMTGHLLGAAGAIEAIATALALKEGQLPGTVGYRQPDPECDLDYLTSGTRAQQARYALSNSLGFGGHNATLCLKAYEAEK